MAVKADHLRNENRWYKLDNAAKIYPAISGSNRASVFRLAVQLKKEVNPSILQTALVMTLPRFPTFAVRMKRGLFWYYFEPNPNHPVVIQEQAPPCSAIETEDTSGFLFRVTYFGRRISLEIFHALADGTGALTFLKSLVFQYLSLSGCDLSADEHVLSCDSHPTLGETEDSFNKYYDPEIRGNWAEEKAYQIAGTRLEPEWVRILHAAFPAGDFIGLVKESGASVTEYITALLIYSVYGTQLKGRKRSKPVKVSVPVNLRNFFPSQTLRNFSSYVNVGLTVPAEGATFEQVLESVSAQMKAGIRPDKLIGKVSANVNAEKNLLMRLAPLFLKNLMLKTAYTFYGESLVTCSLSNLGKVHMPESAEPHIDRFEFVLGAPVLNAFNCGVCSFKDQLFLTFTSIIEETEIERFFLRFLTEKGLKVTIETNEGVQVKESANEGAQP